MKTRKQERAINTLEDVWKFVMLANLINGTDNVNRQKHKYTKSRQLTFSKEVVSAMPVNITLIELSCGVLRLRLLDMDSAVDTDAWLKLTESITIHTSIKRQ